jgi:predicted kinase
MTRLTATRGLPASGKTTWAKQAVTDAEHPTVRVNRDDLRLMLDGKPLYTHPAEQRVTTVQQTSVGELLRSGVNVIVDDTNLRSRYLRNWAELAARHGAEFAVEDFTGVAVEECVRRDSNRPNSVGKDVILSMHQRFLAGRALPLPVPEVPGVAQGRLYVPDPSLPAAVMVDIDGTVALHHGVRDPYDTSSYHLDQPNAAVIGAVNSMYLAGHLVVFCSGREDTFRDVTAQWLDEHVSIPYSGLFMRKAGDKRRDDVIKLELFDKHIRGHYRVACVFDDRDRVVQAWRGIGLTVLQVAEGAF